MADWDLPNSLASWSGPPRRSGLRGHSNGRPRTVEPMCGKLEDECGSHMSRAVVGWEARNTSLDLWEARKVVCAIVLDSGQPMIE